MPDPKNRQAHTLPLSDYLASLLDRRKEEASGSFVFPGTGAGGYLIQPMRQMAKVTKVSGVSFNLHDLRRTFATTAESLDVSHYALKRLLNHKSGADVTSDYVVFEVERLRGPMQAITDNILKLARVKPGAEVIDLNVSRHRKSSRKS